MHIKTPFSVPCVVSSSPSLQWWFHLLYSLHSQCNVELENSAKWRNYSVIKTITSSSGLLLTIFSLGWPSPDFSGSENNSVLVFDLGKTLLLRPHTSERNFSAKERFLWHGKIKAKPPFSETCLSKKH